MSEEVEAPAEAPAEAPVAEVRTGFGVLTLICIDHELQHQHRIGLGNWPPACPPINSPTKPTYFTQPHLTKAAAEEGGEGKKGGARKKRTALSELAVGTELQGKVKGIKDFGIFVDIGAESDGLVHISQMSASFVANPNDLAKVGDSVAVRVLNVDADKRQIALTMKTAEESAAAASRPKGGRGKKQSRAERDDADDEEDAGEEGEDMLKDAPAGDKDVSAFANFDPKKFLGGKVASVQAYGAFIRLDDADIDGLLPTGDMDGKLEAGQRVKVRITDVDTERNR
jgi:transcriptional accessory protein Tex/SPT6